MTAELQGTIKIVCRALGVEAIPAGDVNLLDQWTELPGFTVDRFRRLVLETKARKISTARYWDGAVREAFCVRPEAPVGPRSRLLSERPWEDYLAHYVSNYGPKEAEGPMLSVHRDRWAGERQVLGLASRGADR